MIFAVLNKQTFKRDLMIKNLKKYQNLYLELKKKYVKRAKLRMAIIKVKMP